MDGRTLYMTVTECSVILDERGDKNAVKGGLYLSLSVYEPFGDARKNSGTIGIWHTCAIFGITSIYTCALTEIAEWFKNGIKKETDRY